MKISLRLLSIVLLGFWACQSSGESSGTAEQADTQTPKQVVELPSSPAVSADGMEIHYEVKGSGDIALVLVHGWCIDGSYWSAQVEHFADRYRVVTIDLAGHGQSGVKRKKWTMQAFAADVQAVVERLDLKKVVLAGHSMSDGVVMEAARNMPDRVLALIGIDTFIEPEPMLSEEEQEEAGDFLEAFSEAFQDITYMYVGGLIDPGTDSTVRESILQDMIQGPPEVCSSILKALFEYHQSGQYLAAVKATKLPIYAINAEEPFTEDWQAYIPGFEWIPLDNVGHYPMREDPQQFNRKLAQVLDKIEVN